MKITRTVFFICSLLISSSLYSANVDSLSKIVYHSSNINIQTYKKLLDLYVKSAPDSLESIAKRLLTLSIEQKNYLGENVAYTFLGDFYSEMGNHELALNYLNRVKNYYRKKNVYYELSEIYNFIGNVYFRKGEFVNALNWYKRQLQLSENSEDIRLKNLSKLNLGRTYIQLGKATLGEKIILEYAEDARNEKRNKELADAYNVLGGYYQDIEDYNLSNSYFQEALKINLDEGDLRNIAHSYNNIAISYFYQDKKNLAKEYFLKALNIRKQLGIKMQIAESYYNLGDWFFFNENYDSARYYYNLSYETGKLGNSFKDMGDALLALSEVAKTQKKYAEALTFYTGYADLLREQYNHNLGDEIANAEFNEMILAKKKNNIIIHTEKKVAEVLNQKFNIEKWTFISIISILLIATFITVYLFKKAKREQDDYIDSVKSEYEIKLKTLEATNTHFSEKIDKIHSELLKDIPLHKTNIHLFCNSHIKNTKFIKISKVFTFFWDAPLDLTSAILMNLFLNKHKDKLKDELLIDEILSQQTIIDDFKVEWMIIDNSTDKIIRKSGFLQLQSNRLLSFSAEDLKKKTLFVHSTFPETSIKNLSLMQKSIDELDEFSDELTNSILKELNEGNSSENNYCIFYYA
jgi:tetratricopeptide (TPR) repeat protein